MFSDHPPAPESLELEKPAESQRRCGLRERKGRHIAPTQRDTKGVSCHGLALRSAPDMATARALLTPVPPPILYHYTTPAGLLGIVDKKEIWASHTQYLNDQREFRHAVRIIQEEIDTMKKRRRYDQHRERLDEMASVLKDSGSVNVCVCSFSEDGDLLSQWRAYGGGGGFSIGFSGQFLRTASEGQGFWLVRCIYDETQQRRWMRTLLTDVLNENTQEELSKSGNEGARIAGGNLAAYLNRYAPILKDKAFAEEKEWRIISRPLSCGVARFDFRPGPGMLIPYYKIPLAGDTQVLRIEEIIVGPTPHSRQSRRSLQSLLEKHGLRKAKVRNTSAPFRNW